ncbi:MAG: 50S ribosomal protein L29 [Bacteroidaceae bacterium]
MKNSEILDMSTKDLAEEIGTKRAELNKMEIDHIITPLENPMLVRSTRRDIARMLTELRRRNLTENK